MPYTIKLNIKIYGSLNGIKKGFGGVLVILSVFVFPGRTFPGHPYFSTQLGPGQLALYNLLKAYSLLDKDVGYCQGLSFIAGILLMHVRSDSGH